MPSLRLRFPLRRVASGVVLAALTGCATSAVVLTPDTITSQGPIVPQAVGTTPQVSFERTPVSPVAETFPVKVDPAPGTGINDGTTPTETAAADPGVGLRLPYRSNGDWLRGPVWSDTLLPEDWEGYSTLISRRQVRAVSFDPKPSGEPQLVAANPDSLQIQRNERNWRYNGLLDGQTVSVGALDTNAPSWGSGVQLGGLQISSWPTGSNAVMPDGEFGFSSTVGGLASSTSTSNSGSYATSAGASSLRYGLTSDFTLESQVQNATSMNLVGVGGLYSLGRFGTVSAGHAQSRYSQDQGHRVSLGYRYNAQAFSLNFRNDLSSPGFADLAAYNDGTTANQRLSNSVRADVPVSGFGTISGTFVGLRDGGSTSNRVGLLQQVAISRHVNLGLGADRDINSGDVSMHMNVTMPVELFVGGLRLPFTLLP
ncbi:hypothetical protein FXN63_05080 [Pigmentiphaga aceris]|uniref:Fimbrial biogenesis outer membrane usher protein n=1 Tax=Pigmentiphaga aceris TaxID=1940612 RepID=A0A5C0AXB1_9BURK|nr:hypothetical protein [Pigmentiphaga aceris]QEI05281.1 hypothetical protein FXN63_05080 [Pigmentiphaga aceris]